MSLDLDKIPSGNSTKTDYGRIDNGTHAARVVSVVDLGIQHLKDFKPPFSPRYHVLDDEGKWAKKGDQFLFTTEPNDAPDLKPQVMITFEFPTERIEVNGENKPRWQGKEYVLSTNEKAGLMTLINAIAPGTKKLSNLLNKPAFVSIGSTESGKAKITSVTAPMKGVPIGELENEAVAFSFDSPDLETFNKLPKFVQNKIKEATNYRGSKVEAMLGEVQSKPSVADTFDDDTDPNDPF